MRRSILYSLLSAIAIAMTSNSALAFCPMCKTAIEGATSAQEFAGSLNFAALVLLAPPVLIFIALFGWFYRLRNASGHHASIIEDADESSHAAL